MNIGTAVPMVFQELLGPLVFTDTHPNEPELHRWVSSVPPHSASIVSHPAAGC